jgi:hypothetical protein
MIQILTAKVLHSSPVQAANVAQLDAYEQVESEQSKPFKYVADTDWEACSCNKIAGACDPFCCCDVDCEASVTAHWDANELCSDNQYRITGFQLLDDCVSSERGFVYNRNEGLTSYVGPMENLFCVGLNNAPEIGNYYSDVEGVALVQPVDEGLIGSAFVSNEVGLEEARTALYDMGQKMKSYVGESAQQNSWPLPRSDSFGGCSNAKSAYFMHDEKSTCTQFVKLEDACEQELSIANLVTDRKVYAGQSPSSDALEVTLGDVYTFDQSSNEYSGPAGAGSPAALSGRGGADCTCSNAVKEIDYRVQLVTDTRTTTEDDGTETTTATGKFKIDSITADVVLYPSIQGSCTATATAIEQTYSISFSTTAADATQQQRSGNFGYLDGFPVKLGSQDATESAISTF